MGKFFQDLKYSARTLAKTPGFTFIAVLTLALGIGASTAVFSVVNGILLKPLPYPQTEKIVIPWRLVHTGVSASYDKIPWGRTDFLLLSRDSKIFQEVGAFRGDSFNFTGSGDPALLDGVRVDRKSTRLNSSHVKISYAVFCLKKKNTHL